MPDGLRANSYLPLHIVAGGDHSLKVPKSGGISQPQVYESALDEITAWLKTK